jgi:hypothetical protein
MSGVPPPPTTPRHRHARRLQAAQTQGQPSGAAVLPPKGQHQGRAEAELLPSHKANDLADTREYVDSSDISGEIDEDRKDEDPGWSDAHGYYGVSDTYTHDQTK